MIKIKKKNTFSKIELTDNIMTIRRLAVLAAIKSNQSNGTTTTTVNNDNDQCLLGHNMSANGDVGMFGVDLHNNVFIQGYIFLNLL